MSNTKDVIEACLRDIERIKGDIVQMRGDPDDPEQPLNVAAQRARVTPLKFNPSQRRMLKGHYGKIYALHWSEDSRHLVSASQDGKLIVWNAFTTNKIHAIPLRSSWVMTCAFEQSGNFVACGGLDNVCTVYKLPSQSSEQLKPLVELAQHEGYLSCCRFVNTHEILTASGDSTCILWDIDRRTPKAIFNDHAGDVMSLAVLGHSDTFVSGSCDSTIKAWDFRVRNGVVGTFCGHESDVNSVAAFPDGNAFASGSDDSSCRIWDRRAYRQVNRLASDKILCGITSVAFSKSGRYLFGGYDDYTCQAWDVALNSPTTLQGHENRVSCVGTTADGKALATGSWDTLVKIWA